MAQVETETEARQGKKGRPVLYVLVAAVVLAIGAGAGLLTWQGAVSPTDRASEGSQDAARKTATGSGGQPANPAPAEPKAQ